MAYMEWAIDLPHQPPAKAAEAEPEVTDTVKRTYQRGVKLSSFGGIHPSRAY